MRHTLFASLASLLSCTALAAPYAYIPYPDGVSVVDVARDVQVWDIPMPGAKPAGVATARDGSRAYFGDVASDQVYVVDTSKQAVTAKIKVASGPAALAVNPAGTRLLVGSAGTLIFASSTLSLIDTATNAVIATGTSGSRPAAAVFSADGSRIYVANGASDTITVHNASTLQTLAQIAVAAGPIGLALHPSGNRLYVGHIGSLAQSVSMVSVVDLDANAVTATIPLGTRPALVVLNAAGTRLYVGNVESDSISVVDTANNAVLATIAINQSPTGLDLHPDESRLYVPMHGAGMAVVDLATRTLKNVRHPKTIVLGRFIARAAVSQPDAPGPLSGLWWNPSEPGWGLSLTQRGDVIFAAWFTYDKSGSAKWYVASECRTSGFPLCLSLLYQVTASRFFGAAFNPSAVKTNFAGNILLRFTSIESGSVQFGADTPGPFLNRTVPIVRNVFATGGIAGTDYSDLWWTPSESGWGLSITHQAKVMFLAWYVYDDAGQPVWYVASNCAVNPAGTGCSGPLYRTTGPSASATFDPAAVRSTEVGSVNLSFADGSNGVLTYSVGGQPGSKAITRLKF
jgi:YVTN family beta-propeller protein